MAAMAAPGAVTRWARGAGPGEKPRPNVPWGQWAARGAGLPRRCLRTPRMSVMGSARAGRGLPLRRKWLPLPRGSSGSRRAPLRCGAAGGTGGAMAGIKGARTARNGEGPGRAGPSGGRGREPPREPECPRSAGRPGLRPAPRSFAGGGRCSARCGAPLTLIRFVLVVALISLSFGGAVGLMFLMLGCALPQYKYRALSFYSSISLLLLL